MKHNFLRLLIVVPLLAVLITAASPHVWAITSAAQPVLQASPSAPAFVKVAVGGYHACGLTASGGVKCWGSNDDGQLGDGTTIARYAPGDVIGLTSGVIAVASGTRHSCALTSGGGVKCWGAGAFGRLGDNGATDQPTPVDVIGLDHGVIAIAAGEAQTCAVTSSGGVKCWGWNRRGVLGDGTTDTRRVPTDVKYLGSGAISVATGMFHSCAVLANGGAKCWGAAGYGQLGNGRTDDEYAPVDVLGVSGVTNITTGLYHTCAIDNGGVKCWGNNNFGQLGDGTTDNHITPTLVSGLASGVSMVDAGSDHNCALTNSGGIKCWGINSYGTLGDGTNINRSTPVDVIGLTSGVNALSVGNLFACAVTGSDFPTCWGYTPEAASSYHVYVPLIINNYAAPRASFAPQPSSGIAPLVVTFNNTSTGSYSTSLWDFGDGITGTLTNPVHMYQLAGIYTATLTVSDGSSADVASHTIEVRPSRNLISNGDFEQGLQGWQWNDFPRHANVVTTVVHSGVYAARLGIEPPDPLEYSYATATYSVSVPSGVQPARLSFWYWPRREGLAGDPKRSRQFAYVLEGNKISQKLFEFDENDSGWQYAEFDLTQYAGHSISIQFGVYHDGNAVYDKRSALYVDDVSLVVDPLPSTDQPVAYYPFNGDASDVSGHGNDGVVYGATLTTDRFGHPNSAYRFNGVSDYIYVPYSSSLSFPQDLTAAAWIKTTASTGGIAHEHNGYTDGNFVLGVSQGGRFRFGRSAILVSGAYDSGYVNDDRWHFVVGVFDHTHSVVKHYIDGTLVLTYTDPVALPDYHIPLIIGDENNHLYAFNGAIDDVRFYNRALSDEEVTALWHADQ